MGPSVKYAKGRARREQIIDVALEVIAREGYHATSLRQLADEVGLSKTGLLHHIGSKEELFVEVLRRRDAVAAATVAGGGATHFVESVSDAVAQNSRAPGLMQLYVRLLAEASDDAHPSRDFFRARYQQFDAYGTEQFQALRDAGRLPPGLDPESLAVLMSAVVDGLQARALLTPELDVARHLRLLLATILRTDLPPRSDEDILEDRGAAE